MLVLVGLSLAVLAGACGGPNHNPVQPDPSAGAIDARIAFESTRDGSPYIYVASLDAVVKRLTPGQRPAWSWDGRTIAFGRSGQGQGQFGSIYLINADGTGLRRLTSGGAPAWSPDGKIAFFRDRAIYSINADGSGERLLTSSTPEYDPAFPDWSPSGDRIAFLSARYDEPWWLYVMNADGSNLEQQFTAGWGANTVKWSPDGKRFVLGTGVGLATLDVGGRDLMFQVPGSPTSGPYHPDWSPDGRELIYSRFTATVGCQPNCPIRLFAVQTGTNFERPLVGEAAGVSPNYQDDYAVWSRRK